MFGVYVHVPFCAARCDYCDFATWTDRGHLMEAYATACVHDAERRFAGGGLPPAGSVFFGGGTPSLLPPELLVGILEAIPREPEAEVSMECNPESTDATKLAAWREAGVNRLSFGVQSMRPHVLAALGRTHGPGDAARAVALARQAGFTNFNLDLIYGAAGETLGDWRAGLTEVLALDPPHLSAYALTVEAGTPLSRRVAAGDVAGPDDDDCADKYEIADDLLEAAGLSWYEISNWAKPGHECAHNRLYWSGGEYLGIGCAAHGHTLGPDGTARRWWNVRTPERYIAAVAGGGSPEAGGETLDAVTRAGEALALDLRTRRGAAVPGDAGLVADGLARWRGDRLVLTRTGRLLATEATSRLLELPAPQAEARPGDREPVADPGAAVSRIDGSWMSARIH